MLGSFSFCNPTKLYFGDESLNYLNTELPKYGKNIICALRSLPARQFRWAVS
ncbi:hypothetical protein [Ruminococcus turbiniformis]|uniref:hypothetical protein n=1 Tax=Ruminococcus turbiniformis TaxID=2881258 RepID=UPI00389AF9B5